MCRNHRDSPTIPGKKICQACRDRTKERATLNNSNGMCRGHSKSPVVPGRTLCLLCITRINIRSKTVNKAYKKQRRATDINFRLRDNLRSRLRNALRAVQAGRKVSAVKDLGCTIPELIKHLEAGFTAGMTWENHGTHGWHIDHIRPLISFDLTDAEQQKAACHYTNLQPLWAAENLSKGIH